MQTYRDSFYREFVRVATAIIRFEYNDSPDAFELEDILQLMKHNFSKQTVSIIHDYLKSLIEPQDQ